MTDRSSTINPAVTIHYEDDQRVYPCRCGETHRGPYAIYDYGHHNCFHDSALIPMTPEVGHYCCLDCGKSFWLKDVRDKAITEGRLRVMRDDSDARDEARPG